MALWLSQDPMNDPAKATLARCGCATESSDSQKKRKLNTCCQVVKYLLATHATDDEISETDCEVANFKQPEHRSAVSYTELFWEKAIHCGCIYEETRVKGAIIERQHERARCSKNLTGGYIRIRQSKNWGVTQSPYYCYRNTSIVLVTRSKHTLWPTRTTTHICNKVITLQLWAYRNAMVQSFPRCDHLAKLSSRIVGGWTKRKARTDPSALRELIPHSYSWHPKVQLGTRFLSITVTLNIVVSVSDQCKRLTNVHYCYWRSDYCKA